MKLETVIHGTSATLQDILDARETRAFRQNELLSMAGAGSVISFSMNIAGAIKSFPLALAAFEEGLGLLKDRIPSDWILHMEEKRAVTGPEALFVLAAAPMTVKQLTAAIEESHPLGRLFDMDVIGLDRRSVSRSALGFPPRTCLICGDNAKACARSKKHSIELVLWHTAQMLNEYFKGKSADVAASCAVRALLYEVSATPKPGLVDRKNSGSHRDMDFFTFLDSSAALIPCFRDFFCIGWENSTLPDQQLFDRLRFSGQEAERRMFSATKGINTHKGLIFASAIVLGALGSLCAKELTAIDSSRILEKCRTLGACSLVDFNHTLDTAGGCIHSAYGLTGARGEAAAGFPAAITIGLPALKAWLANGMTLNDASALALLAILSKTDDTNMIHRGGVELARQSKAEAETILSQITPDTFLKILDELDQSFIQKHLSPGGCADILAISLMFLFLETSGMITPIISTNH